MIAKSRAQRLRLSFVVQSGRCAMGIDVVNVFWLQTGGTERT